MVSITDELRKWAQVIGVTQDSKIWELADNIDAEHRSALEKVAAQLDETSDMREFCGRIEQAAANHEDVTLWGVDYVALPVDADGVPIRPGDELVIFETGEHIRAYDIELYDDGRWLICDDETMDSIHPDRLRHHRATTVEDVLREFADRYLDYEGMPSAGRRGVGEALMDEFAAKLRLAGEE